MAYYSRDDDPNGHPRYPSNMQKLGRGVRMYTIPADQAHRYLPPSGQPFMGHHPSPMRYNPPPMGYHPPLPRHLPIDDYYLEPPTMHRSTPKRETQKDAPRVIDVIGSGHELTVTGHIQLLKLLPMRHMLHRQLLDTFAKSPGNYEGRYNDESDSVARILDYGNGYLAIRLYDDISRPELSEFLIKKEWRMIGFSSIKEEDKVVVYEKWTNMHNIATPSSGSESGMNGHGPLM